MTADDVWDGIGKTMDEMKIMRWGGWSSYSIRENFKMQLAMEQSLCRGRLIRKAQYDHIGKYMQCYLLRYCRSCGYWFYSLC
ncbi:hypothetical protein L1987_01383 [Smallanthus sonchifolius]|uniref:Uncharacterized protein n=1 Tax=Smallanthus sonchifolius TaxID=185202 RepID=A0ACB9K4T9_9ASTR|nr:hypothetical protein L1987_01383 [Smallanthus sonchifolius]